MKTIKSIYKGSSIFLLTLLVMLNGCTSTTTDKQPKRILILTGTTGMIGDAIAAIAGDKAEISSLMGPGVDPHLYKVTQGDLEKLQAADIIFYNGLHLEGKMSDVLKKLGNKKKVIAFSDGIDEKAFRSLDAEGNIHDPHIWFNVALWKQAMQNASKELQLVDTINAAYYKTNTERYANQLDSLHSWIKTELATIPQQSRLLITAHDAFGYFGEAYGIEVKGLQGISTVSDYGLSDVNALVTLITQRKIKAIFVESSVSDKSIKAVVEGCKANGHEVRIGGTLYSDAMGPKDTPEGSYVGMVSANVRTIVNALR